LTASDLAVHALATTPPSYAPAARSWGKNHSLSDYPIVIL
jgi:hypothetical protein